MKTRAFWWRARLEGEIRETSLPCPRDGEMLVRMLKSAISRGTEATVARGLIPESEHERMRCPFQEGDFPFPVKYGYCAVGLVEEGPAALAGKRVFALHPHQEYFILPAGHATVLPEDLPPERAALAANLETALNAVWDAGILPGDRVVVLGAGVVGALTARIAGRIAETSVTLADINPARASLARKLGLAFATPDEVQGEADLVIEASGSPAALAAAFELAGFEGTILALGWYGDRKVALPLGEAFHSRRLRLISSQVAHIAPRQRPRWTHARRMAKVLDLLRDEALDHLLSPAITFESLPERLPTLLEDGSSILCQLIDYSTQPA